MALFLFLLAKATLASLPTAHFVALRPLFPFQQAQYAQVFLLKLAPFCKLSTGLGKHQQLCHFSSLHLLSLTLALSSPPSFLLPQSLWKTWQEWSSFSSCTSRPQWVPRHSFLQGNDVADKFWPNRKRYSCPLCNLL